MFANLFADVTSFVFAWSEEAHEETLLERSAIFILIGGTKNLKQNIHQRRGSE